VLFNQIRKKENLVKLSLEYVYGKEGLPGQDTKDEVHDEEGAQDDHRDKVDELPGAALSLSFKMATQKQTTF